MGFWMSENKNENRKWFSKFQKTTEMADNRQKKKQFLDGPATDSVKISILLNFEIGARIITRISTPNKLLMIY